ncbi:GNAT family N-acetyltransferase [Natronosporangium hydrolyticum]|uniref:GNAT family N-acetyltransferase n=1 Tax=Natronosporangium hydrolyticum TaxID=2811111 RepID=A0A895YPX6_9ACTN|nr:GNAT family N-acetyltransferase [Natronosporangium hydrolyticum]QSB16170.1 GNAT family N-acetyltransferase [Natronosporangium hydrolyticum]
MPATSIDGVRVANFTDLDATTLYELLRLRVDVFVVEQQCPYPELDGRDIEPTTRHLWLPDPERAGSALAYLRLLAEPDQTVRIGRVAVALRARGAGLARRLMPAALALVYQRTCVLDAQSQLVDFYQQYGFRPTGPEYLDDGIPHVPMRRER